VGMMSTLPDWCLIQKSSHINAVALFSVSFFLFGSPVQKLKKKKKHNKKVLPGFT